MLLLQFLICTLFTNNANAFVPTIIRKRPVSSSASSSPSLFWGSSEHQQRVGNNNNQRATQTSKLHATTSTEKETTTDTTTTTTTTTTSDVEKAFHLLQTELSLPTIDPTTIKTLLTKNPTLTTALLTDANKIGYCGIDIQNTADMDFLFLDYYNDVCLTTTDMDMIGQEEEGEDKSSSTTTTTTSTIGRLQKLAGPMEHERLMDRMVRHPKLMAGVLLSDKIRSTEALLRLKLNLTPSQYNKIIKLTTTNNTNNNTNTTKTSNVLSRLNRSTLRSFLSFFSKTVSLSPIQLQRMLVSRPQLLAYSVTNLSTTYNYFYKDLQLTKDEIIKLITSMPTAFTYGLESRIKPNVEFVRNEIGGKNWRKVIYGYPQVFSHGVESVLRPKVDYFHKALNLERKSDVSTIATKFPPTLWLSTTNLQSKLDYLQTSLELSEEDLRYMILSYPQVLGLSLEDNLKPKIDYLLACPDDNDDDEEAVQQQLNDPNKQNEGNNEINPNNDNDTTTKIPPVVRGAGLTQNELKEFVLYQPALLAYSLEKRIRPRIEQMTENGIRFSYAPPHLMSMTDVKFNECLSWKMDANIPKMEKRGSALQQFIAYSGNKEVN